jgi:signal transduction histidine kinase
MWVKFMNIRKRLIFQNAAIVAIPVLITIIASYAFIFISSYVFDADLSYKNIRKLTDIQYEFFIADGSLLKGNSDKLLQKDFQHYISERLNEINSYIVVLKKFDVVFSTKTINQIEIEKCLEANKKNILNNTVQLNDGTYIVKTFPINYADGSYGNAILLSPVGKEKSATEKLLYFSLGVFLLSFLITNILVSINFSKGLLVPLTRLQVAAGEISRGNLDYEIIEDGDKEIRELCKSFEQMRLKLKESVYTQMKYDDNRKMLVSSISHDLKTPITSIKGYVEGIIDGVANSPEKVEKYLHTIHSKASQVDSMIDDLLLYSKLDLNQIPFNFEKTDVAKYFEYCVIENEHELEKVNISLKLQNDLRQNTFVMIDRERLRRVIINIIDNSKKYMNKPKGEIRIILRETPTTVIIETSDNGAGIAKEDLPYIFDRFYRADAARSRMKGSGVGLAIAKQIVEGHGGSIWVRSVENEGTSIMISLKKVVEGEDL